MWLFPLAAAFLLIGPLLSSAQQMQPSAAPQPQSSRCDGVNQSVAVAPDEMLPLAADLIAWIVTKTGLAGPAPPRIAFVPQDCMMHAFKRAGDGDQTPQPNEDTSGALACSGKVGVLAFYQCGPETIFLPDTWRVDDLRSQSILLHELVHHVQRINRLSLPCPAALERQAYELQAEWLRERGIEAPYELIGTDQFSVFVLTACMPPEW